MNRVFADSFYFFALLNPNDVAHKRAMEYSRIESPSLLTTTWVLAELADGLARTMNRRLFREVVRDLEANRVHSIVLVDDEHWHKAIDLYDARPDKKWSLTDCVSFVAMQEASVTDALTGDHHFEQAGFRALLK